MSKSIIDRIRAFFGECEHYVTVKKDDSLWGIAKTALGRPVTQADVDLLIEANPQIGDPDIIKKDDRLRLPDEWFDA